ncbi:Mitochondrial import inner membrane translocase subunit tim22 [Blyttiomyces sp. JEL0837]|nr:Mitochondrial import inner membrane translocase subunit tim22 [Blyttiomyces sp. JEL0837]
MTSFEEGFQAAQADPNMSIIMQKVQESCPAKSILSLGMGFALGGVFGLFMSSVDYGTDIDKLQKMSFRDQVKVTFKDMGAKSYSSAKNFAIVGAVFSGTECVIETYRAKNDIYNGVSAGCITGAALAARGGPIAMASGCATFAAFSAAIDVWIRSS